LDFIEAKRRSEADDLSKTMFTNLHRLDAKRRKVALLQSISEFFSEAEFIENPVKVIPLEEVTGIRRKALKRTSRPAKAPFARQSHGDEEI
jgi:hypothetical protein